MGKTETWRRIRGPPAVERENRYENGIQTRAGRRLRNSRERFNVAQVVRNALLGISLDCSAHTVVAKLSESFMT